MIPTLDQLRAMQAMEQYKTLNRLFNKGSDADRTAGIALWLQLTNAEKATVMAAANEVSRRRSAEAARQRTARRRKPAPTYPDGYHDWGRRIRPYGPRADIHKVVNDADDTMVDHEPDWEVMSELDALVKEGLERGFYSSAHKAIHYTIYKWTDADSGEVPQPPPAHRFDSSSAAQKAQEHYEIAVLEGADAYDTRGVEHARLDYIVQVQRHWGTQAGKYRVGPTREYWSYSLRSGELSREVATAGETDATYHDTLAAALRKVQEVSNLRLSIPGDV